MRGETCCAVSNIFSQRAFVLAVHCAARRAYCFLRRVAKEGYWSPVGFKKTFFECKTDALSNAQCLAGQPHQNESLAVVNVCADVRPRPRLAACISHGRSECAVSARTFKTSCVTAAPMATTH